MIEPTKEEARGAQKAMGFRAYKGPLLSGPRTVIDAAAEDFPPALAAIPHPPERLYVVGDPAALCEGLAVIGARNATPYGLACARRFAGRAAARGIVVISGGARGCDGQAHRAALEAGAPTVVFLGGGCDQVYPASNFGLFQQVVDGGGAVVSEHEWDFPALPYTFRQRNRLIAGLARAVLIVEAGLPSGTFSTADEALEANRDVLVVPGAISSATSAGSNRLLYQGATPVVDDETFDDAMNALFGLLKQEGVALGGTESSRDVLLEALRAEPMRLDRIMDVVLPRIRKADRTPARVQLRLAKLEQAGLIGRYPDGRFGPLTV